VFISYQRQEHEKAEGQKMKEYVQRTNGATAAPSLRASFFLSDYARR
jgi:hypothetical protein